jgi:hypothetical protein
MGQSNATGSQFDNSNSYVASSDVMAWDGSRLVTYAPNRLTGIEWNNAAGYWAAELCYIQHYRATFPTRNLLIVRYTASGTQLGQDAARLDWNVRSSGELFDGARAAVRGALAAVRSLGFRPNIRLLWWQQGESDMSTADLASRYQSNLAALVAAVRDPDGDFAMPANSPFVIGRTSSRLGLPNPVRAAQTAIAHADVGGLQVLLDDDDLPFETDGIHLTNADQIILGDRLWAIDQRTYPEP